MRRYKARVIPNASIAARIWAALLLVAALAGCAAGPQMGGAPPQMGEQEIRRGTVIRIDPVMLDGDHHLGIGAILGAAAGGLVGAQIGQGSGSDVAAVIGAIGGAFLGDRVQNKYSDQRAGQHVLVKLDNGVAVSVTQLADSELRVGDRVFIEGAGQDARVRRM